MQSVPYAFYNSLANRIADLSSLEKLSARNLQLKTLQSAVSKNLTNRLHIHVHLGCDDQGDWSYSIHTGAIETLDGLRQADRRWMQVRQLCICKLENSHKQRSSYKEVAEIARIIAPLLNLTFLKVRTENISLATSTAVNNLLIELQNCSFGIISVITSIPMPEAFILSQLDSDWLSTAFINDPGLKNSTTLQHAVTEFAERMKEKYVFTTFDFQLGDLFFST